MSQAYLPGDTRQRIQDLIKDSSITQAELAGIIGLSESALSRYLKGQSFWKILISRSSLLCWLAIKKKS